MSDQEPKQETISDLFARDPFSYSKQDIDRIVQHYREARRNFNVTGKGVKEKKAEVDLKDLGLL